MNSPKASKINWTSLIILLIGIAVTLDWIPAELEEQLVEMTLLVGPALIMTFRTWFTGNK